MKFNDYLAMDATEMARHIKNKEVSSKQLIEISYKQMELVNPHLNCVASLRQERALAESEDDNYLNRPFPGVPLFLKGISQSLKGELMTSGSVLLKDNIAHETSIFTKQLCGAGLICLGHSTVPEFALKNITESYLNGITRNPWHHDYSPGGSSGGAAALVASGVVPVAGASDGGGSIRIPASFTGLFGLKPTRGRTPVGPGYGRQWHGAAIDFIVSRSVRDSAYMLNQLQVVQPEAAFQTPLYEKSYADLMSQPFKRPLTIGYTVESPVGTPVSNEAKQAVYSMVSWLEREGHHVEEVNTTIDGIQLMKDYYVMNCGEISALIIQLEKGLERHIKANDVEVETWLLNEAGKSISAAEFSMSLASWDKAAEKMAKLHSKYDFYLTPTTASHAPKVGELSPTREEKEYLLTEIKQRSKHEQQELIYDMFLPSLTYTPFTQLANLTGQPAMSVPTHMTEEGLPLGVQFMAGKGLDHKLLQLAFQLEQTNLWTGLKGNPYFKGVSIPSSY